MADEGTIKKTVCPLCGSDEYIENKLDEDVKDAFLESILAESSFTRTYDILGGRLAVTVKALSDDDNRLRSSLLITIFDATEKCPELKAYIPLIESALDIDSQVTQVTISKSDGSTKTVKRDTNSGLKKVLGMKWNKVDDAKCKEFVDSVLETFDDNVFSGCKVPSTLLRGAVGKHNTVIGRLLKECLDENFISGTGR